MLKWMLAAGAAALAIAVAGPGRPEGRQGRRQQEHAGHAAKAQKGGGGGSRPNAARIGGKQQAAGRSAPNRQQFAQRDDKPHGGKAKADGRGGRDDRGKNVVRVDDRGGDRAPCGSTTMARTRARRPTDDVRVVNVDRRPRRPRDARRPRFRRSPLRSALERPRPRRRLHRRLPAGARQEGQRLPASGPGKEAGRNAAYRGRSRPTRSAGRIANGTATTTASCIAGTTITSIASIATTA